jgi:hypothetical protein
MTAITNDNADCVGHSTGDLVSDSSRDADLNESMGRPRAQVASIGNERSRAILRNMQFAVSEAFHQDKFER